MQERQILAVCKDPGGMNGILPVVRVLRKSHEVILIANGKAAKLLAKSEDEFEIYETTEEVLHANPDPLLLITSMCSDGGVGRNLVPLLRDICPSVALSDYWGTRLIDSWKDPSYRPHYMCVNDEFGRQLNEKTWPDFHGTVITGYPMFDKYKAILERVDTVKEAVYRKLGLDQNIPIILFPCGVLSGVSICLREVMNACNSLRSKNYFIPRLHPRTSSEEVSLWHNTLKEYTGDGLIADSSACDTPSILAASTIVISGFSTVLVEAALLQKTAISVFYPEPERTVFKKEFGGVMSEPPTVTLGTAASAKNQKHLSGLLESGLSGIPDSLGLLENQKKHFRADGNNAKRVAEFALSLIH